jgi:hypothetical protein
MPKCVDNDFPCQNPNYTIFDDVASIELKKPNTASEIINYSFYCHHIPYESLLKIGDLTHTLFLKPISGKMGVYHLWSEYDNCDDHETQTMICRYVGKGVPDRRVSAHIKKKWPKGEMLFVTFHECSNRLAKYYEQLFLDSYRFDLNGNENFGTETLYAVWDEERFTIGTHLNEISSLSKMRNTADW